MAEGVKRARMGCIVSQAAVGGQTADSARTESGSSSL